MKQSMLSKTGLTLALIILLAGCDMAAGIDGDGNVVNQTHTLPQFNQIEISGSFDVFLAQSDRQTVQVEADQNLHEYITLNVVNGVLTIGSERSIRRAQQKAIHIGFVDLERIKASGAVTIKGKTPITLDAFELSGRGASTVTLEMEALQFNAAFSGASTVNLSGQAENFDVELSGASSLRAFDLEAAHINIEISGAGDARITAHQTLNARISGAGSVVYQGDPQINQTISGAGSVRKR